MNTTETDPDYDKRRFRLEVAMEARRFEIDLLWRRSVFFWGFIAAAFGAVAWTYGSHPRLAIVFTCFGFVCSVVWTLANRGSRFWHVSWESKVQELEGNVIGPLFSTPRFKSEGRWWEGGRYSPSRLVIALSDYVAALWLALLAYQTVHTLRPQCPLHWRDMGLLAFVVGSLMWIVVVGVVTRRHDT